MKRKLPTDAVEVGDKKSKKKNKSGSGERIEKRKKSGSKRAEAETDAQLDPTAAVESDIVVPDVETAVEEKAGPASWDDLGLDSRLMAAIASQEFAAPTTVQARVIPLALAGTDVLARSRTGTGKTAAYLIPIVQAVLLASDARKRAGRSEREMSAIVLVPTRELASQVTKNAIALAAHSGGAFQVENLARNEDGKIQRARLATVPDLVVATPGRLVSNIESGALVVSQVRHLVIDEADLILSYGYEDDLKMVASVLPETVQHVFMSATLRADEQSLKELFLSRRPESAAVVELADDDDGDEDGQKKGQVTQYIVRTGEEDKFLLAYALFKLKLVRGKTIVFVGDVDRGYRLKLFFDQFGVKSCVLNSELPVNSRIHVVEQFNKAVYDIIIASDENEVVGKRAKRKDEQTDEGQESEDDDGDDQEAANDDDDHREGPSKDGKPATAKDEARKRQKKEYGVSRGVDFKNVACVLNFDLPTSAKSYVHRVGRTGRASQAGIAISFVVPTDEFGKHRPTSFWTAAKDERVLGRIERDQAGRGNTIVPYQFDIAALDGFRYRVRDGLKSVTSVAVREARVRELKAELLNSAVLKKHFDDNPDELRQLRHDTDLLRPARQMAHLKHVPDYLLPNSLKRAAAGGTSGGPDVGLVPLNKPGADRKKRVFGRRGGKKGVNALQKLGRKR